MFPVRTHALFFLSWNITRKPMAVGCFCILVYLIELFFQHVYCRYYFAIDCFCCVSDVVTSLASAVPLHIVKQSDPFCMSHEVMYRSTCTRSVVPAWSLKCHETKSGISLEVSADKVADENMQMDWQWCMHTYSSCTCVCVPTLVFFLLNDCPFRRHNRETPDSHFINQYMDQCTCLLVLSGSRRCLIWYARIPSRDFSNSYLCWPLVLSGKVDVLCSFHLCLYPHDVSGCNLLSSTGVSYCLKCRYGRRSCQWFRLFSSDVDDYD